MIIDKLGTFADDVQPAALTIGTHLLGNSVPLVDVRNVGVGYPLYLVMGVGSEAAASAGASTVFLEFATADDAAMTTNNMTIFNTTSFSLAQMAVFSPLFAAVLPVAFTSTYRAFIGVKVHILTAVLTAGKFNAFLTADPSIWQAYPQGNVVASSIPPT